MKKMILAGSALASVLLTTVAGVAMAAPATAPVSEPTTIKVGAFFPTNGNDSNAAGATQITAGIDYAITKTTQTNPTIPSVYFDYQGGSRNGGHEDTYALGVAVRGESFSSSGTNPYIGVGIGAYDVDAKKGNNGTDKNNVDFGGKIFAGLEFKGGFLVEANYQILPSEDGINPSGFGAQVGYRF
jgi:hypothetical protein